VKKQLYILLSGAVFLALAASLMARGKVYSGLLEPLNHYYSLNYYYEFPDSNDKDKPPTVDLPYPIEDRSGDHVTGSSNNPFELKDPPGVEKNIEYDPETDTYIITERVDGRDVKPPIYMTFEEFREYEKSQSTRDYWKERA